MSIKIPVLLTLFATLTPTSAAPPDLCDLVYTDTGRPILCQAHRDGAPSYDDTVCCDEGSCVPAQRDACAAGELFYCELGEVRATNEVSCYFQVPDYCDLYPCPSEPGFQSQPIKEPMCCHEGVCWPTSAGSNDCELQDILWCQSGVSNPDGTVTCLD